jgi:hypothetical protein
MSELEKYPTLPSPEKRFFNTQLNGVVTTTTLTDFLYTVSPEYRFMAQQMIGNMRLDMLRYLIGKGEIPCKPLKIELQVRLTQESLPDEILYATEGRRIELQENEHTIVTLELPSIAADADWLPPTDKEKEWHLRNPGIL